MANLTTIDSALPALQSSPAASFPLPLKVFISYKQKDFSAAEHIRQQLERIGGNGIQVFVSGDDNVVQAAQEWRSVILKNLREAHVLLFLYTDPSLHWDWCLYETGYFDGRQDPQQLDRRLYLLHRGDISPVGPFLGLKTVPVLSKDDPDDKKLKSFLQIVFVKSTDPPVNPNWDKPDCADLLAAFKEPFGGTTTFKPISFIRRLTYRVAKGTATEASLQAGRIPPDARVYGTRESFGLFNLYTDAERRWEELESQWRRKVPRPADGGEVDSVTLWVGNLAAKMLAAIRHERADDGLPLFYCPFMRRSEQALFRPALAQMTEYANAFEFDVVFVDMAEEMSARSAGPLTTVGILLRLSHMFRFGWIEPMDRALVEAMPNELSAIKAEMLRRLNSITAESFNQGLRTEAAVLQAFEDSSSREQAESAMNCWKEKIAPMFEGAGNEVAPETARAALRDVLKEASTVNWQFHRACALRYAELVEEYAAANKDPDERV
jgi:TIR domain